jgi:hypothetical protein
VKLVETELTPELATRLLAEAHPHQRRPAAQTVAMYARAIREGRWRLIADAILVDPDGRMFNGGHRCAAVIAAHQSIPVMIGWDADPTLFDVIDVGRRRSAYQFISETEATVRASAARVTLWYEHRFDRPLQPRHMGFDLQEIMAEAGRREASFGAMVPSARTTHEYTGLPMSVDLGAYAIAYEAGYQAEVESFVRGLVSPNDLPTGSPVRLLAERFRKEHHRGQRRELVADWTILVRALNLYLEGRTTSKLLVTTVWPRVAESEADFNRRRAAISKQEARRSDAAGVDTRKAKVS